MFRSGYSVSLCCSVYCLCVNVNCTATTGFQTNCSHQIYHIISYHIFVISKHLPSSSHFPLTTDNPKAHYLVSKHPQLAAIPTAVCPLYTPLPIYLKKWETIILFSVPPVPTEHCCPEGYQPSAVCPYGKSNSR
jgi:hypothetical protein